VSPRLRFRLRHAGIAVASLLLATIAAVATLLGTETGTRWVLAQAIRFVPGELVIADYDGTLLRGLRITRLTYSNAAFRLDAESLTLKPDWLRSNRGRIALRQLAAARVSYSSTRARDPAPQPLLIAMPAMPIDTVQAWHDVARRRDLDALDRLLADEVVFHSPVVHTPQRGKAVTKLYLAGAMQVLGNESFRYVREVRSSTDAVLEFTTELDGIHVNGVDIIRWDEDGRIVDFKVMVRPLKAINLLHSMMKSMLEQMTGGK